MQQRSTRTWSSIVALGIAAIGLSVLLMGAYKGELTQINPFIESMHRKLGAFNDHLSEERVYLHVDRPQYKPGEDIWFAAYLRDSRTLKASSQSEILKVELYNPKGSLEKEIKLIAENGVAAGDFHIDEAAPGGQYRIKAYTEYQKNQEPLLAFEKTITVQKVVMPNLKMKLDFQRKAYGAGDNVTAELNLQTNANQPLANHAFTFRASLAGGELITGKSSTNAAGDAVITFDLPAEVNTHDGLLNVMIGHEGLTESVSRSIPIVLNTIDLQLLPEGGDLVAGLRTRVAIRARNEFGKPADVEGVVRDSKGNVAGSFKSFHDGMGAFDFTPVRGELYTAHITKPEGVKNTFELPEALPAGYVLNVQHTDDDGIDLVIRSTQQEAVSLIAQVRGEIYYAAEVQVKPGENEFTIPTESFPIGVAQVSLFDQKGIGRAERLTFVNRDRQLDIDIATDKEKYLPREKVTMTVRVKDEKGMPMPADLSIAVADDQLLAFADDKQGNLLSMMLLQYDLKETVEEPRFYFDPKEEDAALATEYLLMTSGWRRFTWEQIIADVRPPLTYRAERAEVAGYIFDESGAGIKGAKIESLDKKFTATTDGNGHFQLKGMVLDQPLMMNVIASGKETSSLYVDRYGDHYRQWMYDPGLYGYKMNKMAAPMGAGVREMNDAIVFDAMEVDEEVTVAEAEAMDIPFEKMMIAEPMQEQLAPKLKDLENEKAEEMKEVRMDDNLAMADSIMVMDGAGFAAMEEDMNWKFIGNMGQDRQQQAPSYYRARQFAAPQHEAAQATEALERNDFRSTVYWNPRVKVDRTGKAVVSFFNTDAISSFRVTAEGFGVDGTPGRSETLFYTQMPFSMTSRLPVEVVTGDQLNLPVVLKNNTSSVLKGELRVNVPQGFESLVGFNPEMQLAAGEVRTLFLGYRVLPGACGGSLSLRFTGAGHSDAVSQQLTVVPRGFPVQLSASGTEMEKEFSFEVRSLAPRSMTASVAAYPSILSDLLKGVESILQEPYGCFEQTSSSNYPNVMVMHHLRQQEKPDANLLKRTKDLLDKGYKKLVGFETREKGYEWFGSNPGHEALTAYGLLEFHDMKEVYDGVDESMLDRTANWLMARKDGKGGFRRNPQALDQFGAADEDITNAYITYSLAEAGYKNIKTELDAAYNNARKGKDPYVLGLAANALYASGDKTRGAELAGIIATLQTADGGLKSARHSITRSSGVSLEVEGTSLAVLAFMRAGRMDNVTKGVKFIVSKRSGAGGFGSTQATILALKALTQYAEMSRRTPEGGTMQVWVDGQKVMEKAYAAGETNPIEITGVEQHLSEGKHTVKVKFVGVKQALPWSINVGYHTTLPQGSKECVVGLKTNLASREVKMGETLRLTATITNLTDKGQPMTMAVLGIPAGLSPQPWQLKELQEKGVIDFYEVQGNSVACYYRQMKPSEVREIALDLKADIPGSFEAPASCAYLYYTAEHKAWQAGGTVSVSQP